MALGPCGLTLDLCGITKRRVGVFEQATCYALALKLFKVPVALIGERTLFILVEACAYMTAEYTSVVQIVVLTKRDIS